MASSTLFLTLTAALSALQCVVGQAVLSGNASAVIYAAQGYGEERNMLGVLRIQQFVETLSNGTVIRYVNITGRIQSVFPGNNNHGIHIHEKLASRSTEGCSGLGKHFNPKGVVHGPQSGNATTRHIGDLGNVRSDSSGSVNIEIRDTIIQVGSNDRWFDVVGKSIAIHEKMDDLGYGGATESMSSGNSGSIVACGNIYLYRSQLASSSTMASSPTKVFYLKIAALLASLPLLQLV